MSSSLQEIKIIMGTLYNYDLISFMLMIAVFFSLLSPRSLNGIVNLHCNLFDRRRLTVSRLHIFCSFFFLLLAASSDH